MTPQEGKDSLLPKHDALSSIASQSDCSLMDDVLLSVLWRNSAVVSPSLHSSIPLSSECLQKFSKIALLAFIYTLAMVQSYPTPAMLACGVYPNVVRHESEQRRDNNKGGSKQLWYFYFARVLKWTCLSAALPVVLNYVKQEVRDATKVRRNPNRFPQNGECENLKNTIRERRAKVFQFVLAFLYRAIPTVKLLHYGHVMHAQEMYDSQLSSGKDMDFTRYPPPTDMGLWAAGANVCLLPMSPALIPASSLSLNYMLAYRRTLWREFQSCLSSWILTSTDRSDNHRDFEISAVMNNTRMSLRALVLQCSSSASRNFYRLKQSIGLTRNISVGTKSNARTSHCSKCHTYPIYNPYMVLPCKDLFCYYCIREELTRCGMRKICYCCGVGISSVCRLGGMEAGGSND